MLRIHYATPVPRTQRAESGVYGINGVGWSRDGELSAVPRGTAASASPLFDGVEGHIVETGNITELRHGPDYQGATYSLFSGSLFVRSGLEDGLLGKSWPWSPCSRYRYFM